MGWFKDAAAELNKSDVLGEYITTEIRAHIISIRRAALEKYRQEADALMREVLNQANQDVLTFLREQLPEVALNVSSHQDVVRWQPELNLHVNITVKEVPDAEK